MDRDAKIKDLTINEFTQLITKTVYNAMDMYIQDNGVSPKQKKQIEEMRKKQFIEYALTYYVVNLCEMFAQKYEEYPNSPRNIRLRDFQNDLESYLKSCGFRTENTKNGLVINGIQINIQILTRIIQEKYGNDAIVRRSKDTGQPLITYIDRKVLLNALRAKRKTEKEILEREMVEKVEAQKESHPNPTQAQN